MNTQNYTYRLYAQYHDGRIILENMMTGNYLLSTAQEIMCNPKILQLLSGKDAALVRYIAEEDSLPVI